MLSLESVCSIHRKVRVEIHHPGEVAVAKDKAEEPRDLFLVKASSLEHRRMPINPFGHW